MDFQKRIISNSPPTKECPLLNATMAFQCPMAMLCRPKIASCLNPFRCTVVGWQTCFQVKFIQVLFPQSFSCPFSGQPASQLGDALITPPDRPIDRTNE
jgi:hypothetical protein